MECHTGARSERVFGRLSGCLSDERVGAGTGSVVIMVIIAAAAVAFAEALGRKREVALVRPLLVGRPDRLVAAAVVAEFDDSEAAAAAVVIMVIIAAAVRAAAAVGGGEIGLRVELRVIARAVVAVVV